MERRLRVLVVSYYFPPMGLSGVQRTAKLVKYLPDSGVDVSVLTVHPGAYFAFDHTLATELERPGVSIRRTRSLDPTRLFGQRETTVALPAEGRRGFLARLSQWVFQPDNKIGWYPFALHAGRHMLRARPHDLVFASAPPYTGLLVAKRLAEQFGLPLVLDFRDDWVGNPRHMYPTRWHARMAARMERRVIQAAAEIHVINRVIGDALRERNDLDNALLHIVPQGFDPDDFALEKSPGLVISEAGRSGPGKSGSPGESDSAASRCTFLYTGIFYDAQKPDVFLHAFAAAAATDQEFRGQARAHFMGLIPEYMDDLVHRLKLNEHVVYHGYLSHNETVRAQQAADVLWLTIGERPGSEGISTGKLYEYMGACRPILGLVPVGVARDDIAAHGAGFVAHPDRTGEVTERLLELFHLWRRGALPIPDRNRLKIFDRREGARRIADHFRTLAGRSTRTPCQWPDSR